MNHSSSSLLNEIYLWQKCQRQKIHVWSDVFREENSSFPPHPQAHGGGTTNVEMCSRKHSG